MNFASSLIISAALANSFGQAVSLQNNKSTETRFLNYVAKQGKSYRDLDEFQKRQKLWLQTDDFIQNYNPSGFTMKHNKFSDRTDEERKKVLGYK